MKVRSKAKNHARLALTKLSKHHSNPLAPYGLWVTGAALGFIGVTQLAGLEGLFARSALPLVFFCALFFTAWMAFQCRCGWIAMWNQTGRRYVYTKKDDPILFYLLAVLGLVLGSATCLYTGSQLFLG